jgi:phage terminase large subunit-like protein
MSDFTPDGYVGSASPDRVDALVWALTDLMLRERAAPRLRLV